MKPLRFTATGDAFITRPWSSEAPAFQKIARLLQSAEVRFTNLETVIRRDEGFPAAQSGGTWASSDPEVLDSLRDLGFNLVAWANNHTLDYSYGGLSATERALSEHGFVHAGVGQDLASASEARYLSTPSGKVALIAATSTFHESWIAGEGKADVRGRPGVNPLRFQTQYRVLPERLSQLQAVSDACGINTLFHTRIKEGFALPDPAGVVRMGKILFALAENGREREETRAHPGDLQRLVHCVRQASKTADYVVVSLHVHEGADTRKDKPADFLIEASHALIDAGAHAIIGHGPHILRGVEIYQGRPIFYSLGNFIFQNERVRAQPVDFYRQYNIDPALSVEEAFAARSAGGTRGLALNSKAWHSVLPFWTMEKGKLRDLVLYPLTLGLGEGGEQQGLPKLSLDPAPLEEIAKLSEPFGTKLSIRDGVATL